MASHGGMREGSGRPAGAVNKATSELKLSLSELAREYTNDALDTLIDVMQSSQSDSARIAAATASCWLKASLHPHCLKTSLIGLETVRV